MFSQVVITILILFLVMLYGLAGIAMAMDGLYVGAVGMTVYVFFLLACVWAIWEY